MVQFFRKIRQSLLTKGKAWSYLKYAFGEIILVMFGILLALQVNNWNQDRIQKKAERKMVAQLLVDAKADSIFFQTRMDLLNLQIQAYDNLISLCEGTLADSLKNKALRQQERPFIRLASQSNLAGYKSKNYDLLSNEDLKNTLSDYEANYEYVSISIKLYNTNSQRYSEPLLISLYNSSIRIDSDTVRFSQLGALCSADQIQGILTLLQVAANNAITQVANFLNLNTKLIGDLNNYLVEGR